MIAKQISPSASSLRKNFLRNLLQHNMAEISETCMVEEKLKKINCEKSFFALKLKKSIFYSFFFTFSIFIIFWHIHPVQKKFPRSNNYTTYKYTKCVAHCLRRKY